MVRLLSSTMRRSGAGWITRPRESLLLVPSLVVDDFCLPFHPVSGLDHLSQCLFVSTMIFWILRSSAGAVLCAPTPAASLDPDELEGAPPAMTFIAALFARFDRQSLAAEKWGPRDRQSPAAEKWGPRGLRVSADWHWSLPGRNCQSGCEEGQEGNC